MKLLKYLLFIILIAVIGGAIFFGTQDGTFDVAETKEINAPTSLIYDQVKDFKNWKNWGPWMRLDPNIKIDYAEKTEGEGASYSWKSDHMEVGNGNMETTKVIPFKEMQQKITFETPLGDSKSDVYWKFEETDNPAASKVTWGMRGEQSFLEKVFIAFQKDNMETGIEKMFQTGLSNIDSLVTVEMKKYSINVDGITKHEGGYYMFNTVASKKSEISTKMAAMMEQLTNYMDENKLKYEKMPFTIYNQIDDNNGNVIFSACMPVKEKIVTPLGSPILCGYMESQLTLKTTLKGNYEHLEKAYTQAKEYMETNQLLMQPAANIFEVYRTDPTINLNPAEWITEIYIPIIPNETPNDL